MASFTLGGKEYTLKLTFAVRQRIMDATKIDLAADYEKIHALPQADLTAFCNVVYHWIKPDFRGEETHFAELIDGDALEAAHEAVLQAVIDFFPQSKRSTLHKINEKSKELDKTLAVKGLEVMDRERASLLQKIDEASIESLTTWLGSLASKTSGQKVSER